MMKDDISEFVIDSGNGDELDGIEHVELHAEVQDDIGADEDHGIWC